MAGTRGETESTAHSVQESAAQHGPLVNKKTRVRHLLSCIESLAEMKIFRDSVAREAVMEVMKSKGKFEEKIVEALTDEIMSFNEKVTQNCVGESPKITKKLGPNEDSFIS